MTIQTVAIVGLGSLGIMYGNHLSAHMETDNIRIVAEKERIDRYKKEGVYCNGKKCDFHYVDAEEICAPVDLLIFSVKFNQLADAMDAAKNQVGPNTIILSLLNGIGSEELIGERFGYDKVLYSVAQGMDAVKEKNRLTYHNMGFICFGVLDDETNLPKAKTLKSFFEQVCLPHEFVEDMKKRLWGKFMLNVGVNQAVSVYECDYGAILKPGKPREMMIAAMNEVIVLAEKENVSLTAEDLPYWLRVLEGLNHNGKPSMRQDMEAKRKSEVELFAGAVLRLSKKHNICSPVNQMFYDRIKEMERYF